MLPENIRYTLQTSFHLLRHFESVNSSLFNSLVEIGYTSEQIHHELSLAGSRFHSGFATDIESLLNRLAEGNYRSFTGINGNLNLEFFFQSSSYPDGIGKKGVVPLSEIPEEERSSIIREMNRGVELLHFKVDELPDTLQCTMVLKPIDNGYLLLSAFPGGAAMPVPKSDMSREQYHACRQFWDNHVFLKLKK